MNGNHESVHGMTGVVLLAARMREELDGLDIGVAVDDPARHFGPRVRLNPGHVAQTRHEYGKDDHVADQPQDQRQGEAPIMACQQGQRAQEIDHHIDADIQQCQHCLAHGQSGLHDLLRNAAGKLVLKETQALAKDVAMRPPPHQHRKVPEHALKMEQAVPQHEQRVADEHCPAQDHEQETVIRQEGLTVSAPEPVDEAAHEAEKHDLGDRDNGDQQRGDRQPRQYRPGIVEDKGNEAVRGHALLARRIGFNKIFESGEHRVRSPEWVRA